MDHNKADKKKARLEQKVANLIILGNNDIFIR